MSTSTAIRPVLEQVEILAGSRWRMLAALIASDALALLVSVAAGVMAKFLLDGELTLLAYLRLWPFLLVFIAVYFGMGLYSGVALSPQEELRRTTYASTIVFLTLAAVTVTFRGATSLFTWTLLLSIAVSVALVPIFRASVRYWLADSDWWGFPAVIFGSSPSSVLAIRSMRRDPGVGLRPVAILDESAPRRAVEGVPMIRGNELPDFIQHSDSNLYAVIVLSGQPYEQIRTAVDQYAAKFSHMLIVPDLMGFSSYWVNEKMVGGQWGLEVCQRATLPEYLQIKRCLDLVLCVLLAPISLPLIALIALWVKLDSPGPVFFGHRRIGRNGRSFVAWKFRSMVVNGDAVLARHLAENPAAREEWEQTQKLAYDPRVTRAGAFLRKSSLDELPQLWNVLRGEMSHVGPRPIVDAEVPKYGDSFELYKSVDGGMTGLWQVSGRSDTSYSERVTLDTFYARNWSIWLDLCILFRTIGAVLFRKGAY
jgi:Undecaprenyl-phosphate galactose phosphotransferase WbaP